MHRVCIPHGNSKGKARGRSKHKNNNNIVRNLEYSDLLNVPMNHKSLVCYRRVPMLVAPRLCAVSSLFHRTCFESSHSPCRFSNVVKLNKVLFRFNFEFNLIFFIRASLEHVYKGPKGLELQIIRLAVNEHISSCYGVMLLMLFDGILCFSTKFINLQIHKMNK